MSVLSEICEWAGTLPYWEQAALCRILSGSALSDSNLDELLRYMLEDEDLFERGSRPTICLEALSSATSRCGTPTKLLRISQLENVNALVPGQTLTFGPALTLIYGGNGSGKSGYARVLGCAGFTRGDREVLPDVGQPLSDAVPSAAIQIQDGESVREIRYPIGRPCAELSALYVFDSTSVHVHLTKSNTIGFSPAGLSSLTDLAEVTDRVRERLSALVQARSQPHTLSPLFIGESAVSQLVGSLGPDTDMARLQALATVTPADMALVDELDLRIAQLKSEDIPAKLSGLGKVISDLQTLAQKMHEAEDRVSDRVIDDIASALAALNSAEAAARDPPSNMAGHGLQVSETDIERVSGRSGKPAGRPREAWPERQQSRAARLREPAPAEDVERSTRPYSGASGTRAYRGARPTPTRGGAERGARAMQPRGFGRGACFTIFCIPRLTEGV